MIECLFAALAALWQPTQVPEKTVATGLNALGATGAPPPWVKWLPQSSAGSTPALATFCQHDTATESP
jgi:hypothetical protein